MTFLQMVAETLFEVEGKLLAAASGAANVQAYLVDDRAAAYDLVRAVDLALIEVRCLQAAYAGDDDATGL